MENPSEMPGKVQSAMTIAVFPGHFPATRPNSAGGGGIIYVKYIFRKLVILELSSGRSDLLGLFHPRRVITPVDVRPGRKRELHGETEKWESLPRGRSAGNCVSPSLSSPSFFLFS